MAAYSYKDHLNVLNGFLAKADSKDKLTALIQYACLLLSAGEPGNIKKIQVSVTAARKIFRVMRPLELIVPLLNQPGFSGKQPKLLEAINKIKSILLAVYFGADHMVWAYQIGLVEGKAAQDLWQKVSLWGWALGSVCQALAETFSIVSLSIVRKDGESEEDYNKRVEAARAEINQRLIVLVHGVIQAVLAAGLLGLTPFKPRTLGLMGVMASTINCYLLYPAYPKLAAPAKKTA